MKIYFAHPITDYGTRVEKDAIKTIRAQWPDALIVNPGSKAFQDVYSQLGNPGMNFFIDIIKYCRTVVAMPFRNNKYGAGVYKEMCQIYDNNEDKYCRVYTLSRQGALNEINPYTDIKPLSVAQTKRRLKFEKANF